MHKELKIDDEFKSLIPPLSMEEFNGLEQSIINEGCRDPLVLWDELILDGHNRYNICMKNGIIFKTVEKNFDNREDAKIWILENQLGRRNLNDAQHIDVVDKLFGLTEKQDAKQRMLIGKKDPSENLRKGRATDRLGSKAKVSGRQYEKGIKIKTTDPDKWNQCLAGQLSIDKAFNDIKNDKIEAKIAEQKIEIEKGIEQPDGLYDIIVIDPPWDYSDQSSYDPDGKRGTVDYPTITLEKLKEIKLPLKENAVIWLWVTNSRFKEAIELTDAWNLTRKTILTWNKIDMGVGNYLRNITEHCILCFKGDPYFKNTKWTTLISEKRTKHSIKPEIFYKLVEETCVGKKLDYFGRKERDRWDIYGVIDEN
jgi:N6-adenosine-specific RNA methylase IME4